MSSSRSLTAKCLPCRRPQRAAGACARRLLRDYNRVAASTYWWLLAAAGALRAGSGRAAVVAALPPHDDRAGSSRVSAIAAVVGMFPLRIPQDEDLDRRRRHLHLPAAAGARPPCRGDRRHRRGRGSCAWQDVGPLVEPHRQGRRQRPWRCWPAAHAFSGARWRQTGPRRGISQRRRQLRRPCWCSRGVYFVVGPTRGDER
jgi:hypothetical protein